MFVVALGFLQAKPIVVVQVKNAVQLAKLLVEEVWLFGIGGVGYDDDFVGVEGLHSCAR